ncbi:MAG: cbb3-type cytochrome c oxidase subunit I [Armatimonadetes bacterium]|nr:cbb3-type cytochrome c oxidase subunit I [Armatimonadota bacterium]
MFLKWFSDEEFSASKNFCYSAVAWLVVGVTFAVILAIKFVIPDFLGVNSYLTFGRVRVAHVQSVALGFLSAGYVASLYYMVPRLTGVRLYSERLGNFSCLAFNLTLSTGILAVLLGYTEGREYLELPRLWDWLILGFLLITAFNVFSTIARRRERQIYVSLWYFMGTMVWFPLVWFIGNRTFVPLSGLNDAAVNWFYGHNHLGLWFTTVGVGMVYYLIPVITRNPLFSHKLSLIGFWSIAMVYAPTGAHHLLQAPIPEWLKSAAIISSLLLLIPVSAAVTNFYMTTKGKWHVVFSNVALRFTMAGVLFYLMTCLQGPFQAARPVNFYLHFSNWVVAHAHLALLGSFGFFTFGAIYHMLPRILKKNWYSMSLANWHYWLTFLGFWLFFIVLTIAGLQQAAYWSQSTPWIQVVRALKPMMVFRMFAGFALLTGQLIFAYNVVRTALMAAPQPEELPAGIEPAPARV